MTGKPQIANKWGVTRITSLHSPATSLSRTPSDSISLHADDFQLETSSVHQRHAGSFDHNLGHDPKGIKTEKAGRFDFSNKW
eukprot:681844-Amphidinium_carterae.2